MSFRLHGYAPVAAHCSLMVHAGLTCACLDHIGSLLVCGSSGEDCSRTCATKTASPCMSEQSLCCSASGLARAPPAAQHFLSAWSACLAHRHAVPKRSEVLAFCPGGFKGLATWPIAVRNDDPANNQMTHTTRVKCGISFRSLLYVVPVYRSFH